MASLSVPFAQHDWPVPFQPVWPIVPQWMLGTPQIIVNTANAPANQPRSQANYDRWMKNCKDGWRATGDPWAVAEATTCTFTHQQVMPPWLYDAVLSLVNKRRTKKQVQRAREAAIRFRRYEAVLDARKLGLSWKKSYERAAETRANTPAAAEAETIWDSYKQVKKDLEKGRGGLYFLYFEREIERENRT